MTDDRSPIPRRELEKFSLKHAVRELSLFGSILRSDFGPASDVDVLVEFEPEAKLSLLDLMDLREELSAIFGGREVDLVEKPAIRNPFRRREILATREKIYVAEK